jgi:hypothetical protein
LLKLYPSFGACGVRFPWDVDDPVTPVRFLGSRTLGFGLLLWLTYAYFIPSPSWNPNSRFDLTLALVDHHSLRIDDYHDNTGDKAASRGHYYSDKAPGVSFLAIPAYAAFRSLWLMAGKDLPATKVVGRDGGYDLAVTKGDGNDDVLLNAGYRWGLYVSSMFTNGLAGACLGAMLFWAATKRGRSSQDATAIAMSLSLGTLVFPYSTTLYGHVPCAAFAFAGFSLLWIHRQQKHWVFFVSGVFCSMATVCEWPAALISAFIGGSVFFRTQGVKFRFAWMIGAALPAAVVLAYNNAAFGSPFAVGYSTLARADFAAGMSSGFMGISWPSPSTLVQMLFGRARGLLYTAPILGLAAWGYMRPRRGLRDLRVTAGLVTCAFVLMSSGYFMWWGGAAFGPRHVIPCLPFWCLGLVIAWPHSGKSAQGWLGQLFFVCFALSILNMFLGTAVGLEVPSNNTDILFNYTYPLTARGRIPTAPGASNLGRLLGLPGLLSIAPLVLLWSIYIAWAWRLFPSYKGDIEARTNE